MRPRAASASVRSSLPFSTDRAASRSCRAPLEHVRIDLADHHVAAGLRRHLRDAVAHEAAAEHSDALDLH
jgi:hypothetical protein